MTSVENHWIEVSSQSLLLRTSCVEHSPILLALVTKMQECWTQEEVITTKD